ATVPLFNVWTMWWNADRVLHGFRGYWDAPIFHPAEETFAFSEPQPTTVVVAPVVWLTGSRVLAYNVYLWLSLVLNGVFAERLLRLLGVKRLIAVGGGAAMLLLPIVHWQLGVVQLVPLWGILWTWTVLVKLSRRPTLWRGVEAGAAFGVTFLTCVHHGLFLAVLLAGAVWMLPRRLRQPRTWFAWLAAGVAAAVIVGPVALKLHHTLAENEFTRTREVVGQLSAMPGDYTAAPGRQWIDPGDLAARPYWRLSPGWIKVGLAVVGVAFGLWRRRWRRWTLFLLLTAALAFLLSLGPNLHIGSWRPWWTLMEHGPGLSQVRNVFRFAFFVQMAAVLFAAQGLHGMWVLVRRFLSRIPPGAAGGLWRMKLARYAITTLLAVLGLAAIFETRPERPRLAAVPDAGAHAGWIAFVREHTPPGRAIACVPFAGGNQVGDYEATTRWMHFGTFHGVPLVNGYSGFFPKEHFEIRDAVNTAFPSEAVLQRLADRGVEFVVVDRSAIPAEALDRATFGSLSLERVFADPGGVEVYRLRRAATGS
ncbi:MAG: hypothetical protein ACREIV_06375, partial [Planctomycetaceae bacterium]